MPAQNIIDALGISWRLDTSSDYATLMYNHPVLGLLQYTGIAKWLPDNVNTLHLTSRGDLPAPGDEGYVKVLPDSVCIRPLYDSNGCGCYDLVTYDNAAVQCECKDPGCDCIPEKMCLDCNGTVECCEGNACIGRDGVDNPSGPGYELCCTLLGVNVCGVWYCSAGQWKVDIYCNDELITTNDIDHEGCPLKLGTTSFSGCDDCVVCVGPDCEPDPPPDIESACCPGVLLPSTFNMTIAGCYTDAVPLVYDGSSWVGVDSNGRIWTLACFGATWMLGGNPGCSFDAHPTASCAPFQQVYTYSDPVCPAPFCNGFTATVTA